MTQTTQVLEESDVEATRHRGTTYWIDERDGKFPLPWWKLLPLVLLIGAAVIAAMTLIMIPIYEDQVIENTEDELRATGISPTPFDFDASYRDLTISGILPEGVSEAEVRAAAERGEGVRDLDLDFSAAPPAPAVEEPEQESEPPPPAETAATEVTAIVSADGVVLTGEVPSATQRDPLVAQAASRFGAGNVTDELVIRDLEPTTPGARGRVWQLAFLLGTLPDGAIGTASISDAALTVDMTVSSEADAEAIHERVNGARASFDRFPFATITVDAPPVDEEITALQAEFEALSVEIQENVTFAIGSDVLNDTATETLDKVVDLMTLYTLPVVEISGHTDDRGNDANNLALSDARAAAVRQYIIDAGIDGERIQSIGKGETEPIDSNETAEGRANNRRVELIALETFVDS